MKKTAIRETQTVRAGRSNAESKIFAPPKTPFPGAHNGQNLISWRTVTTVTYRPSLVKIDARDFELSWCSPTPPARPPVANIQTGPITIHSAAKLSAQCN